MTYCIRCRRPMKHATETGMGPVCARAAQAHRPVEVDRDLFGYDVAKAESAARDRLQVRIESQAADAAAAVRRDFRRARQMLLGWELRA